MTRPRLRALVLAAGRGERLRPLTAELPKPLLPIAGLPVAAWTLERLAAAGVEAAALNLHHLGGAIRAAFGERFGKKDRALPLVYSEEPELLGTGGAFGPLAGWLAEADAVLAINGDSLCRWPLDALLRRHRKGDASATLLFHRTVAPGRFGGGVAVESGRVVAWRRHDLGWRTARVRRVFAGAAVLRPELLARLPAGPSDVIAALYEPLLADGATIAAVETARPWFDLGTPARYLEGAVAWALSGRPARSAWVAGAAEVAPGARLAESVVEAGAAVGAGARLDRCLILPGARVGAGARLARTIVGPGAAVAPGAALRGVLVDRAGGTIDLEVR